MPRLTTSSTVVLTLVACSAFDPRSTRHGTPVDEGAGRDLGRPATPSTRPPVPPAPRDSVAIGKSHLFIENPAVSSLSIFDLTRLPSTSPLVRNVGLEAEHRVLVASDERELVAVLLQSSERIQLLCPEGPDADPIAATRADAAVILAIADGSTRILAYDRSAVNGTKQLTLLSTDDCDPSTLELEKIDVGESPHEVALSERRQFAYVSSSMGVHRLNLSEPSPRPEPMFDERLRDLILVSLDEGDFLMGRGSAGVVVLEGATGARVALADAADGGAGGAGGATTDGSGGAGAEPDPDATFTVLPAGGAVLVTSSGNLRRYALPTGGVPDEQIESPGTNLTLGPVEDCGVAFTPDQKQLSKLVLAPLSAESITLERPIASVELLCRPAQGAAPASCCSGVALVSHVHEAQRPLGQTDAFSIVDLTTTTAQSEVSSLTITGVASFDAGKAVLLTLESATNGARQLRVMTPFEASLSNPLLLQVSDSTGVVGTGLAQASVGFAALRRRDGALVFATRAADAIPTPSSYRFFHQSDFRLTDRVTPLSAAGGSQ